MSSSPGPVTRQPDPTRAAGFRLAQIGSGARWVASRVGQVLFVLFAVAVLSFSLTRALPGDAAEIWVGPMHGASPATRAAAIEDARERLGLNRTVPEQFMIWAGAVVRGDFGRTVDGQPVRRVIGQRFVASIQLVTWTMVFSIIVSMLMALYAMRSRFRWVPRLSEGLSTVLIAVPGFWIAFLLVLAFAVQLRVLPASGYVRFSADPVRHFMHMILPMLTLSAYLIAVFFRYLYSSMQDAQASPYATTALAKGLSQRAVLFRHILPNSLLPFVTAVGMIFGVLIGGTVIIEQIFSWPGLGLLMVHSASRQDINLLVALVLVVAFTVVIAALIVDVLYRVLDPRMRRN